MNAQPVAMTFGRNDLYNVAMRAVTAWPDEKDRIWRATDMVEAGLVTIIDNNFAAVQSQTDASTTYMVEREAGCPCPDRTVRCKHFHAVNIQIVLNRRLAKRRGN